VHGLVIQPGDAKTLSVAAERFDENQIRPAARVVEVLLALDPAAPLSEIREPGQRVVGTCRHFALLACALLRFRGIAARVRCGFATYFLAVLSSTLEREGVEAFAKSFQDALSAIEVKLADVSRR
jgi:Transglutaminase-like superfamily